MSATMAVTKGDQDLAGARTAGLRKSICFVVQQVNFGGTEVHTLALMRALLDEGYDVELVSNRYHGYDDIIAKAAWRDRVQIVHTDVDGIMYGERSNRAEWRRVFRQLASDVMVLVKGNNNYGQPGFLKECRRAFKKVIFIEHLEARERPRRQSRRFGFVPGIGLWWYKRMLFSRIGAAYADSIVAVSEKVKSRLVDDFGYSGDKVTVVRNGVPWRDFTRTESGAKAVRDRHGIPADRFVFGMMTRLSHEKGVDIAIRAARRLVDDGAGDRFRVVIAGEGYALDELKQLVTRLELQNHVNLIGFVNNPSQVLSTYDAIVFSSRVEGLPLGLLQGMAAGCIPIVTRISGMPEAVNSPDVGWVVPPESPDELAGAMRAALALDDRQLAEHRRRVVRRIQEHFDIDASNRRLVEICQSPARSC